MFDHIKNKIIPNSLKRSWGSSNLPKFIQLTVFVTIIITIFETPSMYIYSV